MCPFANVGRMLPHRGRFQRLPAPPASTAVEVSPSQVRYEEDPPKPARVLVHVDYADGTAREWEAREPPEFTISTGMAPPRRTGLAIGGEENAAPVYHAVPTLTLRLVSHPRYPLHERTHGPWRVLTGKAHDALASFLTAMGYQ